MPTLAHRASATVTLHHTDAAVMHTLLYFDVFRFPLKASEILEYCNCGSKDLQEITNSLLRLTDSGMLKREGEFYSVSGEDDVFERRIRGNAEAIKYLSIARKLSLLISLFPFVRGVMISGSLSKGFMDGNSDIDYFIVTEKGRLWICRSMLAGLRKILPMRLKKYLCINYFIDDSQLEIPEKNLFTATEIAFIHPTYNPAIYQRFIEANQWISDGFYPNKHLHADSVPHRANSFVLRVLVEKLLSGGLGDRIESKLHRFMSDRWEKRFKAGHIREEFELNFRTRKNAAKHHPKAHQAKILSLYQNNILAFESRHGVTLSE